MRPAQLAGNACENHLHSLESAIDTPYPTDCEVTETAALHVPGRTIRQRMKDCRGHSSGSGGWGMAGWGQRWAAACGRECVSSAPCCRPTAHEHEGRPAGRKRGVQGGRCPSVGAAREAGRPGPWESVVWGGGGAGGGRVALGATARVPKGSASTKSMGSGGWWAGRQGAAAGTRARDATRAATQQWSAQVWR